LNFLAATDVGLRGRNARQLEVDEDEDDEGGEDDEGHGEEEHDGEGGG
jgi:hypothetical protein